MKKLLLIDGNSILNRAYFALPALNDKTGRNVNAVYGFINILLKVCQDYSPEKLVVAFDMRGHNFRKDIYADYKANRKGMPDDLALQMPILHDLLAKMSVTVVEKAGVEADDIIGTITKDNGYQNYVVSGDRDMLQLVSPSVTVLLTKRGVTEVESVTPELLKEVYCLTPAQVIEYKALRGDTSDNIPGVKGIGEKTAMSLLEKYGYIDTIFANVDAEKGALREKLVAGKEMAYVSKTLATIVRNADVQYDLDSCGLYSLNGEVKRTMEQLQFRSILSRLQFEDEQTHEAVQVDSIIVDTAAQLQEVAALLAKCDCFAFHYDGKTVYLADSDVREYVVQLSDSFLDELTEQTVFETLKPLLESDVAKSVYDQKNLQHVLQNVDVQLCGVKYDVCLMQYLVEYRAYKDLRGLIDAYGYQSTGAGIFALAHILQKQLGEHGVWKLYEEVELPLSDLLYRMEIEGVQVDCDLLEKTSKEMHKKLDGLTEEICQLAGETFNLNSTAQLSKILFEKLNLPHGKKNQRGYSTSTDVLEPLVDSHPIVGKILEYRKVSKLLGTYVDGLRPLVRHGLVHTTYNQTLTSTGRLSSSDPNLQNIPIRDDAGREIRRLFLPKHGKFVGADYSQIELRLLAAFSMDENLLSCFMHGEDIHAKVASELLGIPVELVNPEMRRMAKAVNFGIIYGISDFGLSQNTNVSVKKAHEYIQLYFERFPKIKSYLDGCVQQAKETGYVTTITGRRRQIPEIKSANYNLRSFGERAAMNMPLQGSAADIMKIAMLKVDSALQQSGLKSKLVLQIHDEIIVDCYPEEAEEVKRIVKEQMEAAVSLACPLVADTEEGETLYEA